MADSSTIKKAIMEASKAVMMSISKINKGNWWSPKVLGKPEQGSYGSKNRKTFIKTTSIWLGSQKQVHRTETVWDGKIIIFLTKQHKICDDEKVPNIKIWLGQEGLWFIQTLIQQKRSSWIVGGLNVN